MKHKFFVKIFHIQETRTCPNCGAEMRRIHRRLSDRILSLFIPVIRCYCCDESTLVLNDVMEIKKTKEVPQEV